MTSTPAWIRLRKLGASVDDMLELFQLMVAPVKVYSLASRPDVEVFDYDGWPDHVAGQVDYNGYSPPQVFLNANHSEKRRRFTLAHELGHVMLHLTPGIPAAMPRDSNFTGSPEETAANRFAAAVLIPVPLLLPLVEKYGPDSTLLAPMFRVSRSAMSIRLRPFVHG